MNQSKSIASSPTTTRIPSVLEPWRDWVLYEQDFGQCFAIWQSSGENQEDFHCALPGVLQLKVDSNGAQMKQHWQLKTPSWIELPGDENHWPQFVRVNGQAQIVLPQNKKPAVYLSAGEFDIEAQWFWHDRNNQQNHLNHKDFLNSKNKNNNQTNQTNQNKNDSSDFSSPESQRPEQFAVPKSIALIQLTLDGKNVDFVERKGDYLYLSNNKNANDGNNANPIANNLVVQIHRHLEDGLPAILSTQIQLEVSGVAREIVIGPVLPAHFEPLHLESRLNAQWLADQKMKIQLQPGIHFIELRARATQAFSEIKVEFSDKDWAQQEIWSFQDAPFWRNAALQSGNANAQAIDPVQAQVPEKWRNLPAFVLQSGALLKLEQHGRGSSTQSNRLSLNRELWLHFDAKGYFSRDQLTGTMNQGWRLDVQSPYVLERAQENFDLIQNQRRYQNNQNNNQNNTQNLEHSLLITQGEKPNLSGVEWRFPQVALDANLRLEPPSFLSVLPVHGWQHVLDEVRLQLHLPAGYRLLAAIGADQAEGSWITQWNLLDVFYAAFVVLLARRWLGLKAALLVAAYWFLAVHELSAPKWSLVIILALGLILKALIQFNRAQKAVLLEQNSNSSFNLDASKSSDSTLSALKSKLLTSSVLSNQHHQNRLQKILWILALVFFGSLLFDSLTFVPHQLRSALYPQLEKGYYAIHNVAPRFNHLQSQASDSSENIKRRMADAEPLPPPLPMRSENDSPQSKSARFGELENDENNVQYLAGKPEKSGKKQRYNPSTILQTGSPQPQWEIGNNYKLKWSGPVSVDQSVRLLIAPPFVVRIWRLLIVILLGFIVFKIAHLIWLQRPKSSSDSEPPNSPDSFDSSSNTNEIHPNHESAISQSLKTCVLIAASLFISSVLIVQPAQASNQPKIIIEPAQTVDDLRDDATKNKASSVNSLVYPPSELLEELAKRLKKQAPCWPECASVSRAEIKWQTENRVVVGLEWHIGAPLAVPLPQTPASSSGTTLGFQLQNVMINNQQSKGVLMQSNSPWLSLNRGVHWVELTYQLRGHNASLQFGVIPQKISVLQMPASKMADQTRVHWQIDGIDDGRFLNETLQFSRQFEAHSKEPKDAKEKSTQTAHSNSNPTQAQSFTPYVRVTRELHLDLDWTVITTVTRLTSNESGLSLNIPLLKGERVTTANIKVQDVLASISSTSNENKEASDKTNANPNGNSNGNPETKAQQVLISIPSGVNSVQWSSRLDKTDQLKLVAPALSDRAENWRFLMGSTWHAKWSGVPANAQEHHSESRPFSSVQVQETSDFSPLPNEVLTVHLHQPESTKGATKTIHRVALLVQSGLRANDYKLHFQLNTSQGGEHIIQFPTSDSNSPFELLRVTRNQTPLNLQLHNGQLRLPVVPGEQDFTIALRQNTDLGWLAFRLQTPEIDLGLPSANIELGWNLPQKRWLLKASGEGVSPAILFWGELLVALVLAWLISLKNVTGLKRTSLFLLVLGFSTFSWKALLVVLFWLSVIQWRSLQDENSVYQKHPSIFNLGQIALAFLTLVALVFLIEAIPNGLLKTPNMRWVQSSALWTQNVVALPELQNVQLRWYIDLASGVLPKAEVFSLPMWIYRVAMLVWALWLAISVFDWLKRAFSSWSFGGRYWQTMPKIARVKKSKQK